MRINSNIAKIASLTSSFDDYLQTALTFVVDIDNNSNDFYLAQDFNYLLKESNSNSQNLFSNSSSSDIKYRGPPIT